jgi:hypothetical protein
LAASFAGDDPAEEAQLAAPSADVIGTDVRFVVILVLE